MRAFVLIALVTAALGCDKQETQIKPSPYDLVQDVVNGKKFKQVDGNIATLKTSVSKLNKPSTPIGTGSTGWLYFGAQQAGGFSPPSFANANALTQPVQVIQSSSQPFRPMMYITGQELNATGQLVTTVKESLVQTQVPSGNETQVPLTTSPYNPQPTSPTADAPPRKEVATPSAGPASVIIYNHIHNYPTRDDAGDDLDDIGVSMSARRRGSDDFELFKALLMASPNQVYRNLWHTIQDWRQLGPGENINEAAPGLHGESITTGPGGAAYQIFWREGVTQYAWFRRNDR